MSTDRDVAAVRQELAALPLGRPDAELAAITRVGGTWHRRGTPDGAVTLVVVSSPVGAVIRRVTALCAAVAVPRPQLHMRAPGGVHATSTWAATMPADTLASLGVVTSSGAPAAGLPPACHDAPADTLRGALLVAASVSPPHRPAHLELRAPSRAVAVDLLAVVRALGADGHDDVARDRVACKSREGIAVLLEAAGAVRAAQAHRTHGRRRDLRNRATRLANADAANVARTIEAASHQVAVVQRLVDAVGWQGLPDDLRSVALARLANPAAPLAELGRLSEPPVGKSAVHRRLRRLEELAAELPGEGGGGPG